MELVTQQELDALDELIDYVSEHGGDCVIGIKKTVNNPQKQ